ncbi:hypothetical protein [Paenibacillus sp. IHBB 10380]|uniref:hypothetical protein n=1 Tax=Paenibacillus sp. IHBB 10380 TaxID=1566358 RepID=UPI000AE3FA0F|nr:hypothetical protein [Paenibacillus sp. IHBB 10380]
MKFDLTWLVSDCLAVALYTSAWIEIYGGHDNPTEDIIRRHTTSIQNLVSHLYHIDDLIVIDNSESTGEIVLEIEHNVLKYQADLLRMWVQIIKQYFRG